MLLWLLLGFWAYWPATGGSPAAYAPLGGNLMLFILLALLGWKVFGPALRE